MNEDKIIALLIECLTEIKKKPNESFGNYINVKAALNALDEHRHSDNFCEEHGIDWAINLSMAHIVLNNLADKSKTGHLVKIKDSIWDGQTIVECYCSECHGISFYRVSEGKMVGSDFCPCCGIKIGDK